MPEIIEWHRDLQDQGLVLIGVHTERKGETMAEYVEEAGVDFPVCIDSGDRTVAAYGVDSFPDYCLIDRAGVLRVADLANADLDRAVKVLLDEPVPAEPRVGAELAREWPGGRFDYVMGGEDRGSWSMRNRLQDSEELGRVLHLQDTMNVRVGAEPLIAEYDLTCRPGTRLQPLAFESKTTLPNGEEMRIEARFGPDGVSGTRNGEEFSVELPADVVVDFAMLRLVTRMPFEPGRAWSFDVFDASQLELETGHRLLCRGTADVTVGGEQVLAWRFDQIHEDLPVATYRVSPERTLVKLELFGDQELVLAERFPPAEAPTGGAGD